MWVGLREAGVRRLGNGTDQGMSWTCWEAAVVRVPAMAETRKRLLVGQVSVHAPCGPRVLSWGQMGPPKVRIVVMVGERAGDSPGGQCL